MRKEAFVGRTIEEATAKYVISPSLTARTSGMDSALTAKLRSDRVIQVRYTTYLKGLTAPFAVKHKYSFPLLPEIRETGLVLHPSHPTGTSEILIAMNGQKRGYFNITVHDDEDYILSCTVLTYDRRGRVEPYAPVFQDKFVSPLALGHASLSEGFDEQGRRVLRLTIEIQKLEAETQVKVGYNAAGIHAVEIFRVGPRSPIVISDLLLEDNPALLPGIWVVGATDERDRMIVNGIVQLDPVRTSLTASHLAVNHSRPRVCPWPHHFAAGAQEC